MVATRTPLTASGAQLCPLASMTAIHNTSVVLKTKSPIEEMAEPAKRSAKFLLIRKLDLAGGVTTGEVVEGSID